MTHTRTTTLLAATLLATACGRGTDVSAPTTTSAVAASLPATSAAASSVTTTSVTTTSGLPPELTDEQQIVAVVERFYEIVIEANNPPILHNPIWDQVTTPDLADGLRETASKNIESNEGLRHPVELLPRVVNPVLFLLENDVAVLDMCLRDDAVLYDLGTGATINDDVLFVHKQVLLSRSKEIWKIKETTSVERYTEEATCVLSY